MRLLLLILPFIVSACGYYYPNYWQKRQPSSIPQPSKVKQIYSEDQDREKEPARDRDRDRDRDRGESIDDRERRIVNDKIIDLERRIRLLKAESEKYERGEKQDSKEEYEECLEEAREDAYDEEELREELEECEEGKREDAEDLRSELEFYRAEIREMEDDIKAYRQGRK